MLMRLRGDALLGLGAIPAEPEDLPEIERELCRGYEGQRLREFCAGRTLARSVLQAMGHSGCAIPRARNGGTQWPEGTVGSLSHSGDLVGAVAGPAATWRGMGLDVERTGRVDPALWNLLFTLPEQERLRSVERGEQLFLATAFFSVKEAFLKLPSPRPELITDYHDMEVRYRDGRFSVHGVERDLRLHFNQPTLEADVMQYGAFVVSTILLEVPGGETEVW